MIQVTAILLFLTVPAAVVLLCRNSKVAGKVGAVLILYFLGILVSNLFVFPHPEITAALYPVQDAVTSVTVPLALPLILFACDFRRWPYRTALKALLLGIIAVVAAVVSGYFIFGERLSSGAAGIAGMAVGLYSGGTPNLASLKLMLDVDDATYVVMNSFDMLVSFVYLIFLMSAGVPLFRKLLPVKASGEGDTDAPEGGVQPMAVSEEMMYRGILTRKHFLPTLKAVGLAVLIAGAGIGLSFALKGGIDMIILILTLTTLSLAASFIPAVHRFEKSYDAGMYLVLVFSLAVASMVDIRSIDLIEGVWVLCYIVFVIFTSLLAQVILGRIFKVDADTTVITSVALVNSPLFVPMVAGTMKNRGAIITGIAVGIVGYAVGNYLGLAVFNLLS